LSNRNIFVPEVHQLQRVAGRFLDADIACDRGQQLQIKLRGKKCSGNSYGVVDARVGIENDWSSTHTLLSYLLSTYGAITARLAYYVAHFHV